MGQPKDLTFFIKVEVSGVHVYHSRMIASNNEEIDIVLRNYLGMKYLKAENVKID